MAAPRPDRWRVGRGGRLVFAGLAATDATAATTLTTSQIAAKVDPGLVDVNTTLGYQSGKAAGTGMVLTSSGEVLTNNHVIDGATSIKATDVGNGRTYTAKVVGYDETHDVAVLQLQNASGLQTVPLSSAAPQTAQKVVALGNALGKGGTPSIVSGRINGLDQSITASDEGAGNAEQLTGMIGHNAPIQPGDSGGALVNTEGEVIGMNTAASDSSSSGSPSQSSQTQAATQAFAIPITRASSIADQIEAGTASSTVHIGATAFLGVETSTSGLGSSGGSFPGSGGSSGGFPGNVPGFGGNGGNFPGSGGNFPGSGGNGGEIPGFGGNFPGFGGDIGGYIGGSIGGPGVHQRLRRRLHQQRQRRRHLGGRAQLGSRRGGPGRGRPDHLGRRPRRHVIHADPVGAGELPPRRQDQHQLDGPVRPVPHRHRDPHRGPGSLTAGQGPGGRRGRPVHRRPRRLLCCRCSSGRAPPGLISMTPPPIGAVRSATLYTLAGPGRPRPRLGLYCSRNSELYRSYMCYTYRIAAAEERASVARAAALAWAAFLNAPGEPGPDG